MTIRPPARHVTVLTGGVSAERAVSLSSGAGISAALREEGYEVRVLDAGPDLGAIVAELGSHRPDVVFNALHGRLGEDGAIQGVLDWMNIPYTHSGVRASATAMDKAAARAVFRAAGLPVAEGAVIDIADFPAADPLAAPYVIKPLNEGSSVGVEIVRPGSNRRAAIAAAWTYGPHALVEEFIPGRELTVGVMGDRALTVTDITPNPAQAHEFYDYAAKYAAGGSQHILPAQIHPDAFAQALEMAVAAHRALGCSGATRTDFRYDDTRCGDGPGRLVILEVNTQPGMTPTSLLPEQAQTQGVGYGALCRWMVEHAACRT
ncbi:D-alanine--D-alanine ligase [Gluconacetobacter takamatsuzukensis]|uniref:D-alanine--D-alanine ligase n=1 Tax=Gluconacetobacter takamatsuzukensis TaxID=1286190 RepID=A0A7W4PQY9_9PROT|nr:D-alanine--D-alanine ligase [Gluconacetobacter takamatsuzukensis]MBB2204999.1 D-alanine--D-alanine ligase [Gluconacetobacter takamatsuzukensis]